ncbi:MAG: hypothetical protein HYX28_07370 [Candidatus Koribacter versatilis]|uniref:Uncharacterized protein n=1 Tax=Candidatus Korobacter versatilis TaxID=658062 RepID=A0A932A9L5_9BACT|nr:hypothetical protein [Candidatus Koribacter versatilis]
MKTWGRMLGLMIVCGALAGYASAEGYNYNGGRREWKQRHSINARQERQQDRIARGIANGSLSPREASRLEREQARFGREEARLRQGGLSPRERDRLEDQQDRFSRQIYRERRDRH